MALPIALAALLFSATAGSFLGSWSWQLDLPSHFRPQLAALGLMSMTVAYWASSRTASAICLALTLVNAVPLAPYLKWTRAAGDAGVERNERVRVLTFNLQGRGADQGALLRMIERESPDIILLTEVPNVENPGLAEGGSRYPYRIVERRDSPFDVILLSRWKPRYWSIDRSVASFLPVLTVDLCHPDTDTRCFTLVGLHAARPFGVGAKHQQAQLDIAAREIEAASTSAVLLMGDLNMAPWARAFRSFVDRAGLVDTAKAKRFSATWLTRFPLIGLPIDHILINPGFDAVENRLGEDLGSDHLPVLADLMLKSK